MPELCWKPIIVGIDDVPESAAAAAMGWKIATAAGTRCVLVHGSREASAIPVSQPPGPFDPDDLSQRLRAAAKRKLEATLQGRIPAQALEHLEVRLGSGAWALAHAVREHDGGLVVLGGKHHAPPVRWLVGSTAHHAVRVIEVPLLVSWSPRQAVRRILVAVDLSYAATPTLLTAMRFARLFDAHVRALHVLEELPFADELPPPLRQERYFSHSAEQFEGLIDRTFGAMTVERAVRHGRPVQVIASESGAYDADLVVVGSHGRGWVDRLLIGSTTESLINHLPTSLLVVPVRAGTKDGTVLRLAAAAAE